MVINNTLGDNEKKQKHYSEITYLRDGYIKSCRKIGEVKRTENSVLALKRVEGAQD